MNHACCSSRTVLPLTELSLPPVAFCQLNVSQCEISETSAKFVVSVHNPLSRFVDKYVRIPVASGVSYEVLDPKGSDFPLADLTLNDCARSRTRD